MTLDNTNSSRPFPKVTPDRLLKILRMNCESGDILCGDAADEIELLRVRVAILEAAIRRLAEQDATLSVCDGNVTVAMDGTLADEEREAIANACKVGTFPDEVATLRGLLERLG